MNGTPLWYLAAAAAVEFREESVKEREKNRAMKNVRPFLGWPTWAEAGAPDEGEWVVWVDAEMY